MNKIAIVGGGIGGLACAILLSRQGIQVTVYDKAQSPQPVGAGFLLQPPGQAILQDIGVLNEVAKVSVPIGGLQSKTVSGRTLLDLEYAHLKGPPRHGLGVQRSTIYEALLQKAKSSKRVEFIWGSEVETCLVQDQQVTVIANRAETEYDLCILASGSNSRLADDHFENRIRQPYGWGCLWTTFALPETFSPNVLHQRCKKSSKMMGILPVRKTGDQFEAALYWSMRSQDLNALNEHGFAAVKREIIDFWPQASTSLEPLTYKDFVSANYNDIWTPNPVKGRLIAIGDICHATSPQLGQGCTMALLDAWSLADQLANTENDLAVSLQQWWKSRRSQLAYVRHLSRLLTPLFQSESVLAELFRDWVMAPVGRLPPFYGFQLKTLSSEVFLTYKE